MEQAKYHTHITAKHNWFDLNLREVWQYRDLIILFTKRTFALTYKQTVLGPAWIFLNPFLTSIIYTFVFGGIAGMSTDGIPQILFYLCSNAIWVFFSGCVTKNASTFTANAGVFWKSIFSEINDTYFKCIVICNTVWGPNDTRDCIFNILYNPG